MESVPRSDFNEALKGMLAERWPLLRDHCTLGALEAYHQRALSAVQHEKIADHLAICEDCTALLLHGVIGLTGKGNQFEPLKAELAEDWKSLRNRLAHGSERAMLSASSTPVFRFAGPSLAALLTYAEQPGPIPQKSLEPSSPSFDVGNTEEQIDRLYDEIITLTRKLPANGRSRHNADLERAFARLRELQSAAARDYRERFEASLSMPVDAGEELLARVRTLRKNLEDIASSDSTSHNTSASKAPAKKRR